MFKLLTTTSKSINRLYPILILFMIATGCEKTEGEGGYATLRGDVYVRDYDAAGNLKAEYYLPDERVYLIYGDNEIYDDETRTNYDGKYQFKYLNKGTYTIFAYSDCSSCPSGLEPVFQTVEISDKDGITIAPTINIVK